MRPRLLLPVLLFLTWPAAAWGGAFENLGRLEREAVVDALDGQPPLVDPAPDGKRIGRIRIVNLPVFSGRDWLFQLGNVLHRTTRDWMLQRELLFTAGQVYDHEIIEETTRNLGDATLSNVVVILPVVGAQPGTVDVLVVTRDVWSLRFNTDFEFQQGYLTFLTTSLSENNLFGWRKRASFVVDLNQGNFGVGPTYVDPNIAGTRLRLTTFARALFSRDQGKLEGSSSSTTLAYPLFSLASHWGASMAVAHSNQVARVFTGNRIAAIDLDGDAGDLSAPWKYRVSSFSVSSGVTRQFGHRVIQRVSAGHLYGVAHYSFTGDFPDDPTVRSAFATKIFPPVGRVSSLYASYSVFTPRYRVYRDISTFDLREDFRLGPSGSVYLDHAAPFLGSQRDYVSLSFSLGWNFDWLDGAQSLSLGWGGRSEHGSLNDQTYSFSAYFASPVIARVARLVASVGGSALIDDTTKSNSFLGGNTGLRGYEIGDLFGKAYFLGQVEARTLPLAFRALRLGGVLFCDVGDAATPNAGTGPGLLRALRSLGGLRARTDVGVGGRLLIPQFNSSVIRFDWAFATAATAHTQPGWPGRISVGFRQLF
jgi:outer membrane protein assembly factor BamA